MRVTILGSSASYAPSGRACSGYLVEAGGVQVLMDCGNGAVANLSGFTDPRALDAVFVTHAHPDHIADLYCLQALLRYAPEGQAPPLRLHGPAGLLARLSCLVSDRGARELAEAFDEDPLRVGRSFTYGPLAVSAWEVEHSGESFALVVEGAGRKVCYTGDASPGALVEAAAAGCDLLLAEATLPERYSGAAPHMTASEAGRLAERAGAGRLVLTHVWPTNGITETLEAARAVYPGPVSVAAEGDVMEV